MTIEIPDRNFDPQWCHANFCNIVLQARRRALTDEQIQSLLLDSDIEEVDDSDQDPDFVLSDCSGEDEAIEDDTLITVELLEKP